MNEIEVYISERDFEIYRLRKYDGLKFREIADQLTSDGFASVIDEDTVKRACRITKPKIGNLYK